MPSDHRRNDNSLTAIQARQYSPKNLLGTRSFRHQSVGIDHGFRGV